jgi:mono/diheme cytochrome c family protein
MIKYTLLIYLWLTSFSLHADSVLISGKETSASEVAAGRDIYKIFCANACHQIPDPQRLKPQQWRAVLHTMQTRMQSAGMTPLSDEQLGQVLEYLSQESR